jgi:hypothetical protein
MNTNRIPESYDPLMSLALKACGGTAALAASLGLTHHGPAAVRTDTDALETAQAAYLEQRTVYAAVRQHAQAEAAAGRTFCANAIDMLKSHLGRRWNARWEAVGFTGGSLALQYDPLGMLRDIAAYLTAHPERENAPLEITAARAEAMKEALVSARTAADAAHTAEARAKQGRDAAFRRVRRRLSGLRTELSMLLDRTSPTWVRFGFRRPADGRIPSEVRGVTVRQAGEAAAVVTWKRSALAGNYRVTFEIQGSDAPPTEVGLFSDRQAIVGNLPSEGAVIVSVTARNRSGETRPTTQTITLQRTP